MQGRGGGLTQDDDDAMLKSELEERSNRHHGKNQNKARSDLQLALELGIPETRELLCLATFSKYAFPIIPLETQLGHNYKVSDLDLRSWSVWLSLSSCHLFGQSMRWAKLSLPKLV